MCRMLTTKQQPELAEVPFKGRCIWCNVEIDLHGMEQESPRLWECVSCWLLENQRGSYLECCMVSGVAVGSSICCCIAPVFTQRKLTWLQLLGLLLATLHCSMAPYFRLWLGGMCILHEADCSIPYAQPCFRVSGPGDIAQSRINSS